MRKKFGSNIFKILLLAISSVGLCDCHKTVTDVYQEGLEGLFFVKLHFHRLLVLQINCFNLYNFVHKS